LKAVCLHSLLPHFNAAEIIKAATAFVLNEEQCNYVIIKCSQMGEVFVKERSNPAMKCFKLKLVFKSSQSWFDQQGIFLFALCIIIICP
jgi:hypothetical protein